MSSLNEHTFPGFRVIISDLPEIAYNQVVGCVTTGIALARGLDVIA
jgi:hypothetical protein